jgi:uncharacterized protein (TIGR02246 family)
MKILAAALCFIAAGRAQSRPEWLQDHFENVDFSAGTPGQMPPGWHLGPEHTLDYAAQIVAGACYGNQRCGNVKSVGAAHHDLCFLYQNVDAGPYRGKWLSYRAAVRTDLTKGSVARLLVRIHLLDGSTSFRDDMGNHPITAGPWTVYEIDAPIAANARDIEFGMQLFGEGEATIDLISLDFDWLTRKKNDEAVRALIQKFADARNAHDGAAAAALYSEDGEWRTADGFVSRGRAALATRWSENTDQVERTVDSIDFPSPDIAVVRVTRKFNDYPPRVPETFILVKENGEWYIRVHEAVNK